MDSTFSRARGPLTGTVAVPGDKSLSHRAVLFSAMAEGASRLSGVLDSADVRSTIAAVAALGANVRLEADASAGLSGEIEGWGATGPCSPDVPIDCGNSGTTARLLLGVLAGHPGNVTLVGDESLSRRPMARVTDPLTRMGAAFESAQGGTLPITVTGAARLHPIEYSMPVASAQVKTALLLAALSTDGAVTVVEPGSSRDHTERLLPAYGVELTCSASEHLVRLRGPQSLHATDVTVPGDPSSAAFIIAAAMMVPGSTVAVPGVSVNETRIGFVRAVQRMGADLTVTTDPAIGREPVGTLAVRYVDRLRPVHVVADEVPSLVDELPILALVASQAAGTSRFEGIGELRVKESDRLEATAHGLTALGVSVRSGADWLEVDGPVTLSSATLASLGDHRLAMTWAVAGLVAQGGVTVTGFDAVEVSYPSFLADVRALLA